VVACLLSKCEALNPTPRTANNNSNKRIGTQSNNNKNTHTTPLTPKINECLRKTIMNLVKKFSSQSKEKSKGNFQVYFNIVNFKAI
jgi:hypothetical protein